MYEKGRAKRMEKRKVFSGTLPVNGQNRYHVWKGRVMDV